MHRASAARATPPEGASARYLDPYAVAGPLPFDDGRADGVDDRDGSLDHVRFGGPRAPIRLYARLTQAFHRGAHGRRILSLQPTRENDEAHTRSNSRVRRRSNGDRPRRRTQPRLEY